METSSRKIHGSKASLKNVYLDYDIDETKVGEEAREKANGEVTTMREKHTYEYHGTVVKLPWLHLVKLEGYICGYWNPAQGLAIETDAITSSQEPSMLGNYWLLAKGTSFGQESLHPVQLRKYLAILRVPEKIIH